MWIRTCGVLNVDPDCGVLSVDPDCGVLSVDPNCGVLSVVPDCGVLNVDPDCGVLSVDTQIFLGSIKQKYCNSPDGWTVLKRTGNVILSDPLFNWGLSDSHRYSVDLYLNIYEEGFFVFIFGIRNLPSFQLHKSAIDL